MGYHRYFKLLSIPITIFFIIFIYSDSETQAVSSPITPTPSMNTGTCKAIVTYSWNVTGIPNANRAFWELKKDSDFTNLEGREASRIDRGSSNSLQGSVTIDLRDYGQVLNGTKYYFRVVAKEDTDDVARRSDSVKFDLDYSPNNTYSANTFQQDPYQVRVDWSNLKSEIDNCSDRVYYEVKKNSSFTNLTGAEPGRIDSGSSTGSFTTINLSQQDPGDYYVRIVGKSGGTSVSDKVNEKGFFDIKTKQGSWVSGAQVKLAKNQTSASTPSYNNTKITNNNGEAVFDSVIRSGAYDVTISKTGCTSINNRTYMMPNSSSYTHYISLDCGRTPPPASDGDKDGDFAARLPVKGALGIDITTFNLNAGATEAYVNTNISLNYQVTGGVIPSHYKVEECSAFDAPYIKWKRLPSSGYPTFRVPTPRKSNLCFQLKRILRAGQEIISNKVSDGITILARPSTVRPPNTGARPPVTGGTAALSCPQLLPAPTISGPLNGAECVQDGTSPGAWFRWLPVTGVGGRYPYHIHFHRVGVSNCSEDGSNDNPPDCWMYDQYTSRTVTEHYFSLEEGTKYRWKVRGVCTDQQGDTVLGQWSGIQEFETRPKIESVSPIGPENGENLSAPQGIANVAVELRWAEPPCGPHNYMVQVFESDSDNAITTISVASDNFVTVYMQKGKSYDWWVRVTGPRDTTGYSGKWSFSTGGSGD